MSTTTTEAPTLSQSETRTLHLKAKAWEAEARTLRSAGLEDDAAALEAKAAKIHDRLEADKEAKFQARERARQAEERRRQELRQREQEEREAIERAVAFLETALSAARQGRIPKAPLLADAEAEGIALHRLSEAARRLGVRELAFPAPGRSTIPSGERFWGVPSPFAGPMDLGPAKP